MAKWLRAKQSQLLWSHHREQYRKAWFATFPSDLWPAAEEESDDGQILLRLRMGARW